MALEAWVALGDWLDSKDRTVPTMKVRCVCLRGRTWINEVELCKF